MLVDYHNHTSFCNHAIGPMIAYLDEAVRQGMDEFGFAEHAPWMMGRDDHPLCPNLDSWGLYCEEVERLRGHLVERRSPMKLRLGVEIDYAPGMDNRTAEFLARYPFDHVIGSVHFVTNGRRADGTVSLARARSIRHLYELYFAEVENMVATGLFDIVGHIDLPKREGDLPLEGYLDLIEDLIPALRESNVVVEINTSGKDKPVEEFFPSIQVTSMLVSAGIPLTLGSDSHSPTDVGRYMPEAIQMLRDCDATEIITFNKRERIPRSI